MAFDFSIMRSLIHVGLAKEEYRPKLMAWLYKHHVPDSMSSFGPFCTKYAFYQCYPLPEGAGRYGTKEMQLTEHYWLVDEHLPEMKNRIITEYMPMDVMRWQGSIPDEGDTSANASSGDAGRATGGDNGCPPFVFSFVPINWEEDFKGAGRTIEDGPNYRWQFFLRYPDSISKEDGETWFHNVVVPHFTNDPLVNRFVSSKVLLNYGAAQFDRLVEIWYEGCEEWVKSAIDGVKDIPKPKWAMEDQFPFLTPHSHVSSVIVGDMATMDCFSQYHGYITMR